MTSDNSKVIASAMQSKKHSTKKLTTSEFIARAKTIHGDRYSYLKVVYKNLKTNVIITCREHGDFLQCPGSHLIGRGCWECGGGKRLTTQQAIEKFKKAHGEKYNYSLVDYINKTTKVKIICSSHGVFEQCPADHWNGFGCMSCAVEKRAANKLSTKEEVLLRFLEIHGDKYDYSLVRFKLQRDKITIICKIHGEFTQACYMHLHGQGCCKCAKEASVFDRDKYIGLVKAKYNDKSNLYILRCWNNDEVFYKVGITCRTVQKRYPNKRAMPYQYEINKIVSGDAEFIWHLEKRITRLLRKYKYKPEIDFAGKTECYSVVTRPILKLLDEFNSVKQLQLLA